MCVYNGQFGKEFNYLPSFCLPKKVWLTWKFCLPPERASDCLGFFPRRDLFLEMYNVVINQSYALTMWETVAESSQKRCSSLHVPLHSYKSLIFVTISPSGSILRRISLQIHNDQPRQEFSVHSVASHTLTCVTHTNTHTHTRRGFYLSIHLIQQGPHVLFTAGLYKSYNSTK